MQRHAVGNGHDQDDVREWHSVMRARRISQVVPRVTSSSSGRIAVDRAVSWVADEPIASSACPQPERVLLISVQRILIVDRALDDAHVGMSLEQLFDPRATAVKDGRRGCLAHRLTVARVFMAATRITSYRVCLLKRRQDAQSWRKRSQSPTLSVISVGSRASPASRGTSGCGSARVINVHHDPQCGVEKCSRGASNVRATRVRVALSVSASPVRPLRT
jgi:hypothetical protein